jgi:soluble lytic murein transglycosylase-like protein
MMGGIIAAVLILSFFIYSQIAQGARKPVTARGLAAARFGLRESLLKAVAKVESNENSKAVGGAGELGMYQMKKISYNEVVNNFQDLAKFPWPEAVTDETVSHYFAAAYLSILRDRYGFVDEVDMLRAYNRGPTAARRDKNAGISYAERVLNVERGLA